MAEELSRFDGKLEPEAKDGMNSLSEAALCSIAISLKRLADEMCSDRPDRMGIFAFIADRMPSGQ